MPNHVHLILTPTDEAGFARAIGKTHRRYTNFINGYCSVFEGQMGEYVRCRCIPAIRSR